MTAARKRDAAAIEPGEPIEPGARRPVPPAGDPADVDRRRRPPTDVEAKALAHPLRQRIVRLCGAEELTNKQLADRLDSEPGTVLHHVRLLVRAGLLAQAPVRTGESGALEKPYRSTGKTWWLSDPLAGSEPDERFGPVAATIADVQAAGPDALATYATFSLHLSPEDVAELDRRILAVLDEYIVSDHERAALPVHRGAFLLHRMPESPR